MHRSWRIIIAASILPIMSGVAGVARADKAFERREDQLKAAYLFNFVKFIEWPSSIPANVLTVCFVGGEGVHDALAAGIANKKVGQRALAVRRLQSTASLTGCNVLYVGADSASDEGHPVLGGVGPVLTVSDASQFARNGGMIEIFVDNNHLRFNINLDSAQRAGLRISSSLLQLAAAVEKGEAE